jgi:hypothetical protein
MRLDFQNGREGVTVNAVATVDDAVPGEYIACKEIKPSEKLDLNPAKCRPLLIDRSGSSLRVAGESGDDRREPRIDRRRRR